MTRTATAASITQRSVATLVLLAPWLWLASFALVAATAWLQLGRLPSYANPDPKTLDGIGALYGSCMALLAGALGSPFVIGAWASAAAALGRPLALDRRLAAAHLLGLALMAAVAFADPLGLMNWLMD